jgi:hypothetical protein
MGVSLQTSETGGIVMGVVSMILKSFEEHPEKWVFHSGSKLTNGDIHINTEWPWLIWFPHCYCPNLFDMWRLARGVRRLEKVHLRRMLDA